jgi:hypothetical protein
VAPIDILALALQPGVAGARPAWREVWLNPVANHFVTIDGHLIHFLDEDVAV